MMMNRGPMSIQDFLNIVQAKKQQELAAAQQNQSAVGLGGKLGVWAGKKIAEKGLANIFGGGGAGASEGLGAGAGEFSASLGEAGQLGNIGSSFGAGASEVGTVGSTAAEVPAAGMPIGAYIGPAVTLAMILKGGYDTLNHTPAWQREEKWKRELAAKGLYDPSKIITGSKTDPTLGKPWELNPEFAATRDVSKLHGSDIKDAAAFYDWDHEWAKKAPEQQSAIAQILLDQGLAREGHGTFNLNRAPNAMAMAAHPNDPEFLYRQKLWSQADQKIKSYLDGVKKR